MTSWSGRCSYLNQLQKAVRMGKKLNTEALGSELKKNLYFVMRAYLSYRAAGLPEELCSPRKGPHRWNLRTLTCRYQAKVTASRGGLPRQNLCHQSSPRPTMVWMVW